MYQSIKDFVEKSNKATLVAVSKTKPIEAIQSMYDKGQRHFGENRVQELVDKYEALPKDINWHLIGSLQKNKVKYIAPFIHMIHSCDGLELAETIDKEAIKNNRRIKVLLQVKIAEEETKQGYEPSELLQDLESGGYEQLKSLEVCGLMGMASFVEDEIQIRREFRSLSDLFTLIKNQFYKDASFFSERSMGMSGDYKIALEEGATMVRIGSALFGSR
ncbi:MAG TPA: YggS family pyridoxal phosphate-dependent enzyme [Saprospiraceae bacterium]|nr:YggS family pyridoxal phosphate-dependent enzyme [Saprospiraceae bacterium]HPN68639.1 YggS family pyridoxal phosphate-dependent enzyme [Saprospiraceae bacterium]